IRPRSITPSSEKNPRSEAASAAIGGRAADPRGGSRRADRERGGGSGSDRNLRERRNSRVAGNAAPAAIMPVINGTHTGVLHTASSAVTSTQNREENAKNAPPRSAHRRFRSILARGSAAALSRSATTSDNSAAVSTARCS